MDSINNLLHKAHLNFQRASLGDHNVDALNEKVRVGTHRIAPRLNMSQAMQDHLCFDYYKVFCEHDKLRLESCTKCKRKGIIG